MSAPKKRKTQHTEEVKKANCQVMKPTIHYQDNQTLVLGLKGGLTKETAYDIIQVFERRTAHLWLGMQKSESALSWPTYEVLLVDPQDGPLVIGHFRSMNGDLSCDLYRAYFGQDDDFIGHQIPVRTGYEPNVLAKQFPGELGRITRIVTRCINANDWAVKHGRSVWPELETYHFEKPSPKYDYNKE